MIDHDQARELFALSFDFALEPNERAALRAHLDDCGPCRIFTHELDDLGRSLTQLVATDAPDRLRRRVLDDIAIATQPTGQAGLNMVPILSRLRRAVMPPYRSPAALIAVTAVVTVAIVAGALNWPTPVPGVPSGSDIAAVSPKPAASVEPGASQDPAATTPPTSGYTAVANLTATQVDGAVLALGSSFRLASLDGTPATDLAGRLTVEPTIKFTIEQEADGAALLTPGEPLAPGVVYSFTLSGPEGQTVDSWAFQTRQPLRIISTLPGDTHTDVPLDTGIEVTFDQDGVTDAASHVTVTPATDGRFEQRGRVLTFVPDGPLSPATLYTVSVSPGIPVGGTGEILEDAVTFRFETAAAQGAARETTLQFS
ncbi:MAG: Ig-like domain-containing protein, partial [Candidatus Limnocylindrales bacterium]